MRCNLSRLVRYVAWGIMLLSCVNILFFLMSPQISADTFTGALAGVFEVRTLTPPSTTPAVVNLSSTVACPGLVMKERVTDGDFQPVSIPEPDSRRYKVYVYSAFLVQDTVKVMVLNTMNMHGGSFYCHVWYNLPDGDPLLVIPAQVENLPENHGRRYTASFFNCKIALPPEEQKKKDVLPYAVSIVYQRCGVASNILEVIGPAPMTSEFTVCVTPFNFRYSRAYELVEMIEMNKLLGARKFIFYNHSTGANVDKVLEMYSRSGDVQVLPWHLPMHTDTWPPRGTPEVHYFAQIAALNDCLYRQRNRSHYVVFTDIDEFIVPKQHENWDELIKQRDRGPEVPQPGQQLQPQRHTEVGAFMFRCVFFRKEWVKPGIGFEASVDKHKSIVLKHTQREGNIFPPGSRSKLIVNPEFVDVMGIHQVWTSKAMVDRVPESLALLHHYRNWERPSDPQPRIDDDVAVSKYGSRLVERLDSIWPKLKDVPLDVNISTYGEFV